jgi:hypothetical protein
MRAYIFKTVAIFTLAISLLSCSVETETYVIETPVIELKAVGPLFEGSNTATATWEFQLADLFPELEGDIQLHEAKVTAVKITPIGEEDFPRVDKMVMEIKSKYISMTRIGLLESNIKAGRTYNLNIADKQKDIVTALQDERITFIGDFDMLEEEYYEDVSFQLSVSFEVQVKK